MSQIKVDDLINEMHKLQELLKDAINFHLRDFYVRTGYSIKDLDVTMIDLTTMMDNCRRLEVQKVKVRLDLGLE